MKHKPFSLKDNILHEIGLMQNACENVLWLLENNENEYPFIQKFLKENVESQLLKLEKKIKKDWKEE